MANNVLGIDVGEQRVGLAIAREGLRIAQPLATLGRQASDFWEQLLQIVKQNDIHELVIGLPRGLEGQDTAQTKAARRFGEELATKVQLPVTWQDEALTSVQAEDHLKKHKKPYAKGEIDAMAASLILMDYLETQRSPA